MNKDLCKLMIDKDMDNSHIASLVDCSVPTISRARQGGHISKGLKNRIAKALDSTKRECGFQ